MVTNVFSGLSHNSFLGGYAMLFVLKFLVELAFFLAVGWLITGFIVKK